MSAGNFIPFKKAPYRMLRQELDWLTPGAGTWKAALLTSAYTPDANAHDAWDDVSAHECADGDYARQNLASRTITQDGSNRTVFDAADVDFGNAVSIAARYMVLFLDTGTPATSYLFGYVDLNDGGSGNVESTNDDFDVGFNASGIYRVTP